jgi:glucose/arabinose dehydrogenase
MGPRGGDELNRIVRGENYGWPVVSEGVNYSFIPIPDHDTRTEFVPPAVAWVPSISPAGLVIYDGDLFDEWQGDAIMGALSGRALVVAEISGDDARESERFEWGARVREVAVGPDGALWVLEDRDGGRLIRLLPA